MGQAAYAVPGPHIGSNARHLHTEHREQQPARPRTQRRVGRYAVPIGYAGSGDGVAGGGKGDIGRGWKPVLDKGELLGLSLIHI
eukprot:1443188-Rhodomonas_salina.2